MNKPRDTVLVIDPDGIAARELAALLTDLPGSPEVILAPGVRVAEATLRACVVDWLFIRIGEWDEWQLLLPHLPRRPVFTVFLSGRREKLAEQLDAQLDGHLQPPYRPARLSRIWSRLKQPAFTPGPLDIFFCKTAARYVPIRYTDLRGVRRGKGGRLYVQTRHGEYPTVGSLAGFQARLPIHLSRVKSNWLINDAYTS